MSYQTYFFYTINKSLKNTQAFYCFYTDSGWGTTKALGDLFPSYSPTKTNKQTKTQKSELKYKSNYNMV